jgi:hypothetical protein
MNGHWRYSHITRLFQQILELIYIIILYWTYDICAKDLISYSIHYHLHFTNWPSDNSHILKRNDKLYTQMYCFQTVILTRRQTNVLQEMEHTTVGTVTQPQKLLWRTLHTKQSKKYGGLLLRNTSREYTLIYIVWTLFEFGLLLFEEYKNKVYNFNIILPIHPDQFWGHPTSYTISTENSFPMDKAARAWRWTLTSIQCQGYVFMAWYLVKHRGNFTLIWRCESLQLYDVHTHFHKNQSAG